MIKWQVESNTDIKPNALSSTTLEAQHQERYLSSTTLEAQPQ